MKQILHDRQLWNDKLMLRDFLEVPLNQKLYEVYLSIKRASSQKDNIALNIFNEVYSICARVVYENDPDPSLESYIQHIKERLGWDCSTSIVLQMVYAVLALRNNNTEEVERFVSLISNHYHMNERKIPFGVFVEETKKEGVSYDLEFKTRESVLPNKDVEEYLRLLGKYHPYINIQNAVIHVESPGNYIARQILKNE